MSNELILVGKIVAAHGIKGQIKILSYTDPIDNIFRYKPITDESGQEIKIKSYSLHQNIFICTLDSISDRNQAETLTGKKLFCKITNLPNIQEDDLFYIHELVNMKILDQNLKELGYISGVMNFGGGDLIEIKDKDNNSELYPFNKEIFTEINKKDNFIIFNAPKII